MAPAIAEALPLLSECLQCTDSPGSTVNVWVAPATSVVPVMNTFDRLLFTVSGLADAPWTAIAPKANIAIVARAKTLYLRIISTSLVGYRTRPQPRATRRQRA